MTENNVWFQLIAAVDYVAAVARPDLTVTAAIDEALRWWIAEHLDPSDVYPMDTVRQLPWDDPDPLRSTVGRLLAAVPASGLPGGHRVGEVIESAIGAWLSAMAEGFNNGRRFATRSF